MPTLPLDTADVNVSGLMNVRISSRRLRHSLKKFTSPLMMLLVLKLSVRPWQIWVFRFLWPQVMFHCNVLTSKVCCIGLPHLYFILRIHSGLLGDKFSPSVCTCCLLHTFQCSWSFSNVVQFCSSKASKGNEDIGVLGCLSARAVFHLLDSWNHCQTVTAQEMCHHLLGRWTALP